MKMPDFHEMAVGCILIAFFFGPRWGFAVFIVILIFNFISGLK